MDMDTHGGETVAARTADGGAARRSLWKRPAIISALVLLIPLMGNQFVEGWNWPLAAFVVAGILVFCTALTYELITRRVEAAAYRTAVALSLITSFFLFWGNFIQGADDINPAAIIYFWVLLVEVIGAAMARLRPQGMASALFVTALAQVVVLAMALMMRNPQVTPWSAAVVRGFFGNALFALLFIAAALLFRTAARGAAVSRVA
jgi:hypothetical protein